jgi:hypothetical protein
MLCLFQRVQSLKEFYCCKQSVLPVTGAPSLVMIDMYAYSPYIK